MSKLDDVLEGTHEPEGAEIDPADFERTGTYEAAARVADASEWPANLYTGTDPDVEPDLVYETAAEVEAALAAGQLDEEQAIVLLDEIELAESSGEDDDGPELDPSEDDESVKEPADPDRNAGPGDLVEILKTGEEARVQHCIGAGGVALSGEAKPRRTLARHEYRLV